MNVPPSKRMLINRRRDLLAELNRKIQNASELNKAHCAAHERLVLATKEAAEAEARARRMAAEAAEAEGKAIAAAGAVRLVHLALGEVTISKSRAYIT